MATKTTKRLILGQGEGMDVDGQLKKHILDSTAEITYEEDGDAIKYMLAGMGILTHDEHDRIVMTPGKYRSYHQTEWNPLDGTMSRVFD